MIRFLRLFGVLAAASVLQPHLMEFLNARLEEIRRAVAP